MFLLSATISSVSLSEVLKDDFRSSSRSKVKPTELIDEFTLTLIKGALTKPDQTDNSRQICSQIREAIRSCPSLYEAGRENKTIDKVSAATVLLAISFGLNTNASAVIKKDFTVDLQQLSLVLIH